MRVIHGILVFAGVLAVVFSGFDSQLNAQEEIEAGPKVRRLPDPELPNARRLPPTGELPDLNPPADTILPTPPLPNDAIDADMVIFAAGAVEFHVPKGWKVTEIPAGRELRLWLTPARIPDGQRPNEGIWMSYQWYGRPSDLVEAARLLDDRVPSDIGGNDGGIQSPVTQPLVVGGVEGLIREYQGTVRSGFHVAVPMSHGLFEFSAGCRTQHYADLRKTAMNILRNIVFGKPDLRTEQTQALTVDAARVVGLWKGLQARLRISGDGRFVLHFDSEKNFPLDESGNINFSRKVSQLTGHYRADDDMVFVEWDDGSRLNYRWRLDNGRLLLTDHNGQVSQLHRLLE